MTLEEVLEAENNGEIIPKPIKSEEVETYDETGRSN